MAESHAKRVKAGKKAHHKKSYKRVARKRK